MVEQVAEPDSEELLSLAFRALGDPTRRAIIQLLRESGELRVSDISAAFEMSLNGVSKHLKVLEKGALIQRRVAGKTHWIGVDVDGLNRAVDWMSAELQFWNLRLEGLNDLMKQETERRKDA